ncbi:metallophosphoesterase family protein [Lacticaseibacillus baoqingensis]|uniref:Metallophosphoesterase family protein n=1 Tax=Lacticaseibacillus baoqingensis TaxID=2486013 RepID=A0ABW4E655_9LACO|nr:metallophosphoesterase family protein [Lacticaseibacillus baoqingensis]
MKQKIALLADIHGNVGALTAVLADALAHHVTAYWFLGDLFLPGPGAGELYQQLLAVKPQVWLRGNWEDAVLAMLAGDFDLDDPGAIYLARLSAYLNDHAAKGMLEKIAQAPLKQLMTVNGVRIQATHNLPDQDEGYSLYPAQPQQNFDELVPKNVDIAVYGHTHQQVMRTTSSGQLVINPGAVGQPYSLWPRFFADQRAHYARLSIDDAGRIEVAFCKVDYDRQQEIQLAQHRHLPYFSQYAFLRESGNTITHDRDLLRQVNAAHHYVEQVARYYHKKESSR